MPHPVRYATWKGEDLSKMEVVYQWADGIYRMHHCLPRESGFGEQDGEWGHPGIGSGLRYCIIIILQHSSFITFFLFRSLFYLVYNPAHRSDIPIKSYPNFT